MKNGLVISDAGSIFSLAILDKLELLNQLFDEVKISKAVWEEVSIDKTQKLNGSRNFYAVLYQSKKYNPLYCSRTAQYQCLVLLFSCSLP